MADRLTRRAVLFCAGVSGVCLSGCLDDTDDSDLANGDDEQEATSNGETGDNAVDSPDDHDDDTDTDADDDSTPTDDSDEQPDNDGDEDVDENVEESVDGPEWMTTELDDVNSNQPFTLAEFEVPILLETFAVWCPDCLAQQEASREFHDQTDLDVVSVGLNVDPNEDADVVRDHIVTHGFDWYFAVAPPELTRSLVDEFGDSIAHPPASPVVLICLDGTWRRLDDGLLPADTLEDEVRAGC